MMENKKSSPLLAKLAAQPTDSAIAVTDTLSDFAAIMAKLDYHSVFDIIRQPKAQFAAKLRGAWEGDAELAYNNAMCYAIQIARSFRERQLTSEHTPPLGQRNGVRALVEIGPTYPNLFKENWDTFCKVGALEAIDSPVSYLTDIYRWAKKREAEAVGNNRIRLDVRRPDLPGLLIDHQSTHQPVPALQLANQVVTDGIKAYLNTTEDKDKSIYAVLAAKCFPFVFPYYYPHHQIILSLQDKKTSLGELMYQVQPELPSLPGIGFNDINQYKYKTYHSLLMLSGLSPQQQQILTESSLFTTYYLTLNDVKNKKWFGPDTTGLLPWFRPDWHAYIVPSQVGAEGPLTIYSNMHGYNQFSFILITLHTDSNMSVVVKLQGQNDAGSYWAIENHSVTGGTPYLRKSCFQYADADNSGVTFPNGPYSGQFFIRAQLNSIATTAFSEISFTLVFDDNQPAYFDLTEEQTAFFQRYYGLEITDGHASPLLAVKTFLAQTGINTDSLDRLLSLGQSAPMVSPHCPPGNLVYIKRGIPFPAPHLYGAVFVNGGLGPAMGLQSEKGPADAISWRLTHTSLNRFDRLQRMIRLQRWLQIPFDQLDGLIVAAARAEGVRNLAYVLNTNTLRALGVFRYLNERYRVAPDEFAAFLHHVSPYAVGGNVPLFDRVFNTPVLFETPLVLDGGAFSADVARAFETGPAEEIVEDDWLKETSDAPIEAGGDKLAEIIESKDGSKAVKASPAQTIQQLCAGLGLQVTADSYGRIAGFTTKAHGALNRNLTIISSLYRQARIPQLFGLSPEEGTNLLELLGGSAYQLMFAKVELSELDEQGVPQRKDTLDVLMEFDWAVRWFKEAKLNVPSVRKLLGYDAPPMTATVSLIGLIQELQMGIAQVRVTQHLFTRPDLPALDWLTVLRTVIDEAGLVLPLPLELDASSQSELTKLIEKALEAASQTPEVIKTIAPILVQLIGEAQASQENLVATVLNKSLGLAYDRAALVLLWAGSSAHDFLTKTLAETGERSAVLAPENISEAYIELLYSIARHAEATTQQKLSASLLRTLLVKPEWLGLPEKTPTLTFDCLYLLNRYQSWWENSGEAEDQALSYFQTANLAEIDKEKQAKQVAAMLARLLAWTADEVMLATKELANGIARTMQQVDWVRRLHDLSQQTGLSVRALQQVTALTAESSELEWQQAGEAAMAAVRTG